MQTGRVENGVVVLEGEPLEDGTRVTVLAREPADEHWDEELTPEQEDELVASLEEADRGETTTWEEMKRKRRARQG